MNDALPYHAASRAQLRQIVAELSDGIILAEPDGRIIWANAAALAMHGCDTMAALGADAAGFREKFLLKFRNHHPLGDADYPIDRLMAGHDFRDLVVQAARAADEEFNRIQRIRGMILVDANGNTDVLVVIIHDETIQYEAETRFEQAFNTNPAPAIICRLNDLRFVKVNQGFLEMTGFGRDEVLCQRVYDIDVLEAAEQRDLAMERLREGGTIPQMEARLRVPAGKRSVIVAGQPIDMLGEPCMLFTFMDLEPRKQAEAALRRSEAQFATAFRLMPAPILLCTLRGFKLIDTNEAFTATFGHAPPDAIGKPMAELDLWDDKTALTRFEAKIVTSGGVRSMDATLRHKNGEVIDGLIAAEIVTIGGEDCVLCVAQDITERTRSEEDLVAAIETVMQDTSWFSRTVIEKLATVRGNTKARRTGPGLADLTLRERQVLEFLAGGHRDNDIARELGVARNTVRNYIAAIYMKLDVHSRGEAIVWARERGLAPRRKN